jgi:hypothetical protein
MKKQDPNQGLLFTITPGSLDIQGEIKGALSKMFRKCGFSRYQIAAQISEAVNYEVSKSMLDNYTGESHTDTRVPAEIIAAATLICNDESAIAIICEACNGRFVSGKDIEYVELAKLQKEIARLQAKELEMKENINRKGR